MHSIVSEEIATPVTRLAITFVDKDSFSRLQSAHLKLDDFVSLANNSKPSSALSVMSHAYLCELNRVLSDVVLGYIPDILAPAQTTKESQYTAYAVWEDMTQNHTGLVDQGAELSYDPLPVDAQHLLVVVQKGFLYHLADSKDNFKQFVLACIRCMDRFNCDLSQLNQLYLQLQLSEAPFELLRCRIQ